MVQYGGSQARQVNFAHANSALEENAWREFSARFDN